VLQPVITGKKNKQNVIDWRPKKREKGESFKKRKPKKPDNSNIRTIEHPINTTALRSTRMNDGNTRRNVKLSVRNGVSDVEDRTSSMITIETKNLLVQNVVLDVRGKRCLKSSTENPAVHERAGVLANQDKTGNLETGNVTILTSSGTKVENTTKKIDMTLVNGITTSRPL